VIERLKQMSRSIYKSIRYGKSPAVVDAGVISSLVAVIVIVAFAVIIVSNVFDSISVDANSTFYTQWTSITSSIGNVLILMGLVPLIAVAVVMMYLIRGGEE